MSPFGLISTIIILVFPTLVIILRLISKPKQSHKLPPGPPKLPIIGNLHNLISKNTPPPHRLQELARVYGPVMHLRLGEISTVVVSSAETAREVLRTQDANFANRPENNMAKELFYDHTDIAFAPYGEYWRQVRKIATLELFTAKRVQSFRAIREEEVAKYMESIAMEAHAGSLVNLSEKSFGLTLNIMSRVVLKQIGKDQEAFRILVAQMTKASSGLSIGELYPSIKLLHLVDGMKRIFKEMIQESNRIFNPIIHDHMCRKGSSSSQEEEDLIDVLLNFHEENPRDGVFSLTINNIKAIILEIFGAGVETSSTIIEWVMSELLKNPKEMKKVQSEVRQVCQRKGTIDESSVGDLKYLKSVIKETLRVHTPVPLLIPRESIEHCQINGYDIPAKTRIIVNAYAIGRDPCNWSDPNAFKPERFEGSSVDYKGNNFELIPFGAGRRMCPAMALGVTNIELPLAMLLYHFDWKLPLGINSENLNMDELFGTAMRRKHDLLVFPVLVKPFMSWLLRYQVKFYRTCDLIMA